MANSDLLTPAPIQTPISDPSNANAAGFAWAGWFRDLAAKLNKFISAITIGSGGGVTITGGVALTNSPAWAITLASPSAGSGSGLNIINTAAAGHNWTLYAASDGSFRLDDNTQSANRLLMNGAGILTVQQGANFVNPSLLTFGSNWISWSLVAYASGSMTIAVTSGNAQYLRVGPIVHFYIAAGVTLGGTMSQAIFINTPTPSAALNVQMVSSVASTPTTSFDQTFTCCDSSAGRLVVYFRNGQNWPQAGAYVLYISGSYSAA